MNSLLIILSIFFGTLPIIDFFVANTNKGLSVSEMAAQSGRFSGIFDQPSEAGLSYSLGILLWLYLFSNKKKIKSYDFFLLLMLFIGGIGTISKIFLIGGSVLFLMYLIYLKGISKFFSFRAIFLGGLISLLLYQFLQFFWIDGLEFLLRLFFLSPDTDLVYLYSAGRFGGSPTYLKNIIDEIWRISPIYGEGFAYELILDNAYAEFFVQGGIIGLAGYILILVSILKTCIWSYRYNKRESILLLFILLLIIGGGLGTPVLTVNRFSTFCWVFIFMIFQILENRVYKYEY